MNKGQSLFEVVFAIGVSALIITGIVILAANAVSNSTFSKNKTLAGRFTQETVEWLRGERDADWDTFYSYSAYSYPETPETGIWCLPSLDWSLAKVGLCGDSDTIPANTIFYREINFTQIDIGNVESKVVVYWYDGKGFHQVSTVTNFTDWRRK